VERVDTLGELAHSHEPGARGARVLIDTGFDGSTRLDELTPGSVTRTLAEALARELAELSEQLGEIYESAFLETETGESLERLVDGLRPCRDER
jgi:hypothetical protein